MLTIGPVIEEVDMPDDTLVKVLEVVVVVEVTVEVILSNYIQLSKVNRRQRSIYSLKPFRH